MTEIRCPVNEAALISRNEPAIIGKHGILLYSELEQCVRATVELLQRNGVSTENRVVLALPASWEFPVVFMALIRIGAVACPVSERLSPEKLTALAGDVGAGVVICTKRKAAGLKGAGLTALAVEELAGFVAKFDVHDHVHVDMQKWATVLTSGRGAPERRYIAHNLGSHYYSAKGANANLRLHKGSRWMLAVPIHSAEGVGVLFRCLLSGTGFVIPESGKSLVDALKEYEVTHVSLESGQLDALLEAIDNAKALPKLQAIVLLCEKVSPERLQRAEEKGFHVYTSYGMPEMASSVTSTTASSSPEQRKTAGKALKYREVKADADGDILVRGRTLFKGYLVEAELQLPVDKDGWFRTGRAGTVDAEGYVRLG